VTWRLLLSGGGVATLTIPPVVQFGHGMLQVVVTAPVADVGFDTFPLFNGGLLLTNVLLLTAATARVTIVGAVPINAAVPDAGDVPFHGFSPFCFPTALHFNGSIWGLIVNSKR
jgi:hypothetical protein